MERFDWNRLWQEATDSKAKNNSAEFWDDFAPNFRKKTKEKDLYVERFYELAELEAGETIFDMGCASGTLAIPYAEKGHEVYAADFSGEMLRVLMEGAEEAGVADRIHPIRLDWNEDWSKRELPKCDVAIASRSLIFKDLTNSLKKLESVSRDRVCIGAWDEPASGFDRYLARAIGYERPGYGVYYYIINELMDRDMLPELRFIYSPFRLTKFESYEAAIEKLKASFIYGLTAEQERLLEEYCSEHLKFHSLEDGGNRTSRGDAQGSKEFWQMDHSDQSSVAFIKYTVKK